MSRNATLSHSTDALCRADFFEGRAQVRCVSSLGTPYLRTVEVGMPKLSQAMLSSVAYLYPDQDSAKSGKDFGGTAFCLGVPLPGRPEIVQRYLVTNWHVAVNSGCSVVRAATTKGLEIFEYDPSEWFFEPRGDDVAIIEAPPGINSFIPISMLATTAAVARHEIGAGEDVFMVGRFLNHDGGPVNQPSLRFGNISAMPSVIKQPTGALRPSYCIDMHSRSGYSGSPVFVFRTPGADLTPSGINRVAVTGSSAFLLLLGIHWGQFEEFLAVTEGSQRTLHDEAARPSGQATVKGLSGMTCVIPADAILRLLTSSEFAVKRAALSGGVGGPVGEAR